MSTGPEGNSLEDLVVPASRVNNYAAGQQVFSTHLNQIQDQILSVGAAVNFLAGQVGVSRSGSGNMSDSPAPTMGGGMSVWVQAQTNGTTVVLLDDENMDWRDRFIEVAGVAVVVADLDFPGEAGDDAIGEDINIHGMFYSQEGFNPAAGTPTASVGLTLTTGNRLQVFVRDTDGALCLKMSPFAADNGRIIARVSASPKQNHY